MDAFEFIETKGVTGVAVVDDETGRLLTASTGRDLQSFLSDMSLEHFDMSILDFITKFHGDDTKAYDKPVATCTFDDEFASVMEQMHAKHTHRCFILDKTTAQPIGVISVKECIQAFISHHDSPIKRDKKVDMSDLPPAISLPQPIRKRSESAGSTRGASGSPDSPQLKPMGIGEMNGDRRERAMGQIGLVTALCEARVPVPVMPGC